MVVALVQLPEGVRILGEMPGVRPDQVRIGMPVRVTFVPAGESEPVSSSCRSRSEERTRGAASRRIRARGAPAQSTSMAGMRLDGRAEVRAVCVLGDWAWVRNHIDLTITPPGGEAAHRSGYTLSIMQKGSDGKWQLARDANLVT